MKKEFNCLVCKRFNPDNIEINHNNAMLRFCRNEGIKLKICPYFVLNEAKYNAKKIFKC